MFYQKYLKYKQKYINLKKYGGYIKGISTIEETDHKVLKDKLHEYMPLCLYDNKTNIILVNDSDYILINTKLDDNYKLYKLTNNFDIIEIKESNEIIEENIIISGINKMVNGINLIQAFQYNNDDIFRNFLLNVWTSGYLFFNRLKDIIYINFKGQILYQNNINIVLSIIFINKLDYVISLLHNLDTELSQNHTNYHKYEQTKKIKNFNHINSELLFDYINAFDYLMIDSIQSIDTFEKLQDKLNNTLSNIEKLKFNSQEQIDEFNTFMKILKIIYIYIDTDPNIVDQYNYSLYIDKYKDFDVHPNVTTYKSLITFINKYNYNTIKNKLVLKLSCLIYLCYKTNIELGDAYKTSQYMLLDYFYGITKIKNYCVPINRRQILLKILEISESKMLRDTNVTDTIENEFYKVFTQKFKQIKQYTFIEPIRYTDCGETTILNLFNYLLLNDDGSFNLSDIDTWDIKLKEFYQKYPTMDSMVNKNIEILKKDLSLVFNNRGNQIDYNNKKDECDINTSMSSIINICAILLNIRTNNFIDIFKKLNNKVQDKDIISEGGNKIKYLNIFTLELSHGHGEFNLNFNEIRIPGIEEKYNNHLKYHWINISSEKYLPTKYSLEHFKFLKKNIKGFFSRLFPPKLQTEEICIEAVSSNQYIYYNNINDDLQMEMQMVMTQYSSKSNYKKVINKTYKISEVAVSVNYEILENVPKELLDKKLCLIAFNSNPLAIEYIPREFIDKELCNLAISKDVFTIKYIPYEFQDKNMVDKIKLKKREDLLKYIDPKLLA